MKKRFQLGLFFLLPIAFGFQISESFFDTELKNVENVKVSFSDFKNKKATVIIFLLTDCPASQSYTLTLNKLSKKYSANNIAFAGVFPGHYSNDEEIRIFRDQYKINFLLLKDPEMELAKKLNAAVAPGCFLISQDGTIAYKGRIDDWLYAVGKKRPSVRQHDLEDAVKSVLENVPVKTKETEPIGCILEYEN